MTAEEQFEKEWFQQKNKWTSADYYVAKDLAEAFFLAGRKAGMGEAAEMVTDLMNEPSACVSAAIRARMEESK